MAFNRQSSTASNSSAAASENKNKAAGYINISVVTKDGTKRLGNSGIPLREGHPLEGAILAFCKENPDRVQELAGRLQITFVETLPEGKTFDLGMD